MGYLIVENLRCEYRENPIGMDILKPRFSWIIKSDMYYVLQSAYRLQVSLNDDFSKIVWDTDKIMSETSVHIEYEGGALLPRTRYYYRVRIWDTKGNSSDWSNTAFWETGLLTSNNWLAEWITANNAEADQEVQPCPILRKEFTAGKGIKRARIYISALGLYELYLNGKRVGDWILTPGWTSYNKRLQYQTYDVTEYLSEGENAIGAMLANGWYKGCIGWEDQKNFFGDKTALIMELHIEYMDGTSSTIITDKSWKTSTGPIIFAEIYHGETYDARLEKAGWCNAGYDTADWSPAVCLEHTKSTLISQENVPVKLINVIKPISIIKTPKGETVIDMGQNMVGCVRLAVQGPAGTKVIIRHAEVLDKEGNFYTENLRSARQTNTFTLKGTGRETYAPRFTFQGFRFVCIEGYPGEISLDAIEGLVYHSAMEPTGSFSCSEPLINQLQHNILWGMKGNFVDVPTDCPQRDERLGWTGDAQMFIRTACFLMNTDPFFTKWLKDLKADQLENGGVPFVIPNVLGQNDHSSSAWGDAAIICPWTVYQCYGDRRILEEQYDSMKAWVEYIRNQGENEFLWNTGFHYGDWLGLDAKEGSYVGATAKDLIATAFYAYSTRLLANIAGIIGRVEDAAGYEVLYNNILKAFRSEFITPLGRLASPTQTAHVLALMFDLVEEKDRKRTVDTLVEYIEENETHLTTGFVGTPYLCYVLSRNGRNDIAYKLLLQKDYPSWLYQVTKGATTIWEHWDGIKEDGSFWSVHMNSFNHYAYGSIGDWLYRVVAGIDTDPETPGYKHIIISPIPGEGIDHAEATLQSVYGEIKSSWVRKDNRMELKVVIPHNTTATMDLEEVAAGSLLENGKPAEVSYGILGMEKTGKGIKLELGSGSYSFSYAYIKN